MPKISPWHEVRAVGRGVKGTSFGRGAAVAVKPFSGPYLSPPSHALFGSAWPEAVESRRGLPLGGGERAVALGVARIPDHRAGRTTSRLGDTPSFASSQAPQLGPPARGGTTRRGAADHNSESPIDPSTYRPIDLHRESRIVSRESPESNPYQPTNLPTYEPK